MNSIVKSFALCAGLGVIWTLGSSILGSKETQDETAKKEGSFDQVKPWPENASLLIHELTEEKTSRWFADPTWRQELLENDRRVTEGNPTQRNVTKALDGSLLAVVDGGKIRAVRTERQGRDGK